MSTLSHTSNHHFEVRTRIALIAVVSAAAVALILALVLANSSSSSVPSVTPIKPAQTELQQQLDSVNGARYGLSHSAASVTPKQQLQAVAGPRYRQPVGIQTSR